MPTYVVGVDSSPESLDALRWTQKLAQQTGARVHVVTAWAIPPDDGSGGLYSIEPLQEAARLMLDRSLESVPADGVERTGETMVNTSTAWALMDAAADADLLVVGTRAHSKFERIIGSVAIQCAQHASCPFVAVPQGSPDPGAIVAVAYDGSDSSNAALKWSAAITASDDMTLRIIAVWEETGRKPKLAVADDPVSPEDRAVEQLRSSVESVVPDIGARVDYRPVYGPEKVTPHLLEAAAGAGLLVVGSRGRGGFTGLLLGSVSQRCLESSPIPVAVIRG